MWFLFSDDFADIVFIYLFIYFYVAGELREDLRFATV